MKEFLIKERYFLIPQLVFVLAGSFLLLVFSKTDLHVFSNQLNSPGADQFFKLVTFLGDGIMYVFVLLFLLMRKMRWVLSFAVSVAVSNLFLQIFKLVLFPEILRPSTYFELYETYKLHFVEGVRLHGLHSFPSGHTTTAFNLFFMLSVVSRKNLVKLLLFIPALITGYSRIYLSQHFLIDVVAGSVLGTAGVIFGCLLLIRYHWTWLEDSVFGFWKKKHT